MAGGTSDQPLGPKGSYEEMANGVTGTLVLYLYSLGATVIFSAAEGTTKTVVPP